MAFSSTKSAAAAALLFTGATLAQTALIGAAAIPGDASDKSGLTNILADGTPHNRLGSFGSGIAYTGLGSRYIAIDDRGPSDGASDFRDRFQTFDITVTPGKSPAVAVTLITTTLLSTEDGTPLIGSIGAVDAVDQSRSLRFDPEGVRISRSGTLWISDEYGPWIDEFSREGRRVKHLRPPAGFLSPHPSADPKQEQLAKSGRQPNRGMEGLAISPDGSKLYGIMQSPLFQDGAVDASGKRKGANIRILEIEPATGKSRQFLYVLSAPSHGVNELLAVDDHQFLVLERDGKSGAAAKNRSLFLIDIQDATDIGGIESLPADGVPEGVNAVAKKSFLDFNDRRFGLSGSSMPEKIEGLAFGSDLPDGRRLLIVTTDNDLKADAASMFWAFAIEAGDLPGFVAQEHDASVPPAGVAPGGPKPE